MSQGIQTENRIFKIDTIFKIYVQFPIQYAQSRLVDLKIEIAL